MLNLFLIMSLTKIHLRKLSSTTRQSVYYELQYIIANNLTCESSIFLTVSAVYFFRPIVDGVLEGYNASVFCYGATGAGKTHTMLGHNKVQKNSLIFDSQ